MTERDKLYDGLKFLLILLVTIGHFSEPFRYTNDTIGGLYSCIYLFHMPLFIMLSGFFSKNLTKQKIIKSLKTIWQPYILMAIVCIICVSHSVRSFFYPASSYWYLAGFVIWKVLLYCLDKARLSSSNKIMLSLVIAVITFCFCTKQWELFGIMKVLCFFPFFVFGAIITKAQVEKCSQHKVATCVIFVACCTLAFLFSCRYLHELEWHRNPIAIIAQEYSLPLAKVGFDNLMLYLVSFFASMALLSTKGCIPPIFRELGSKTLLFYVLQDCIWNVSKLVNEVSYFTQVVYILMVIIIGTTLARLHLESWILQPFTNSYMIIKNIIKI